MLWSADTEEVLQTFQTEPLAGFGRSIAFSHDGGRIAIGSSALDNPRYLRVWNAEDGTLIAQSPRMPWGAFLSVAFSHDDRFIVTASSDWGARLWDAETCEEVRLFLGHKDWVRSAALSPDGRRLATASADHTLKIWDVATGGELLTLTGHKDQVYWVDYSPTENRILSAGQDDTARLWDSITGRLLLTFAGHTGVVVSATFSRNGRRIATSSLDGTVRLWDAVYPEPAADLPPSSRLQAGVKPFTENTAPASR